MGRTLADQAALVPVSMAEAVLGLRWGAVIGAATPQVLMRTAAAVESVALVAMRQVVVATLPAGAVAGLAGKALAEPGSTQAVAVVQEVMPQELRVAPQEPSLRHSQTPFCAMQWPPVRRVSTAARRVVHLRQPVGAAPVQSLAVATAGILAAEAVALATVGGHAVASSAEAVAAQETGAMAAEVAQTAPELLAVMALAAQLAYSFSTDRTPT